MDFMYVIFLLDDAEFDVAATMCSMGTPMILKHYERKQVCHQSFHRSNLKTWISYKGVLRKATKHETVN